MFNESLFELNAIRKQYGSGNTLVTVLDKIDFSVREGEFVCIMGASGSGKSTLLRIMGGIEKQTAGKIRINNNWYKDGIPPMERRDFGYVFQQDNLLAWRTTEKNVNLPLEIFGYKGKQWKDRIAEMLDLVGLLNYKECYPHELSGGMRQRASIARALVHDPKALLLDQPFGALDAITRKELGYRLLKIWKETGKTVVMITNSVDEALLLASRIIVLSSAPAKICHIIENDIPYQDRDESLSDNFEYKRLHEQLSNIVRGTETTDQPEKEFARKLA